MSYYDVGGDAAATPEPTERKKVPPPKRKSTKKAASGGSTTKRARVQPTKGFTPQPIVEAPTDSFQVDHYRDGIYTEKPSENGTESFWHLTPPKLILDKEDTRASIRVYGRGTGKGAAATGKNAKPEKDFFPPYTKMILSSVQEAHQERSQIVETFGDFYLFFFGKRPPVYTFTGTLINSNNIRWVHDFYFYYDNYMRGTKCVENNARVILSYGYQQIEGYIIETSMRNDAESEYGVPFSFQVVVTKRNQTGFSTDFGIYTNGLGEDQYDEDLRALLDSVAGKEGTGLANLDTSKSYAYAGDSVNNRKPAAGPFEDSGGFGGGMNA